MLVSEPDRKQRMLKRGDSYEATLERITHDKTAFKQVGEHLN